MINRIRQATWDETGVDENGQLERRITNYLQMRILDLSDVVIEVLNGAVLLRGSIPSESMRWRCVNCCRSVAGVLHVVDRLVVPNSKSHPEHDANGHL